MAPKKNFYAVLKGRRPGIYSQWTGTGGAQEQVSGFPGAKYQGFTTREEAEYYLRNNGQVTTAQPALLRAAPGVRVKEAAPALSPEWVDHQPDLAAGKVVIFTDGASTGNPGPGGYGIVMLYGSARKELSGGFRCTTNNRMELTGVIVALDTLTSEAPVVLYSDSRYVVDALQKGWAKRWRSRGWMRTDTERAENADLWARLLNLFERRTVELRWVRGHASHPENERCDQLAVRAAHGPNLPEDEGFNGSCR